MTPEITSTLEAPTAAEVRRNVTRARGRRAFVSAMLLASGASLAGYNLLVAQPGEAAPNWATKTVDRGDLVSTASATGNLQPRATVTVGAEISGLIAAVAVQDSEVVEAGQLLATFDITDVKAQVQLERASLSSSNAAVRRAVATYDEAVAEEKRTRTLVDRGVSARVELDTAAAATVRAKADLDRARADAERARASVTDVEAMLGKGEIRSPIAGVILARNVEPGQTVAASLQAPELFVVAEDLARMNLQIWVDEADIGVVKPGQKAEFEVSAYPNRKFAAVVESIDVSPTTTDNVVTYMALLAVDNEKGLLRPGMTAAATITTELHEDVLRVPNAALRFKPPTTDEGPAFTIVPQMGRRFGGGGGAGGRGGRGGGDDAQSRGGRGTVYVQRAAGLEAVRVRTGATDGTFTQILDGELQPGDEVVVGTARAATAERGVR